MTPQITADRWRQIERLFHTTLDCAPEERADFLVRACGNDHELRAEVESLLTAHESDSDSFLDVPAYEVAPGFLADALGGLLAGQEIGPYKILSSLASGGMGEVYLAQDSRLGRKIALKLLPPDFAKDQHRIRRFAQEARAASALNHPNVCVIHEVGKTSDGRHFIAMELIDGITLRERIAQRPLRVDDALVVAEQVAAALVAAHSAGVIHRDIKPENIMLRTDGYVKVLDFGLAKLNESQTGSGTINEASTIAHVHTEPGTQMGTVRYMSPEHLRERPVDERADIWSFGVVLHEMVTGVTPFEARTRNEIVALILKRQPARLRFLSDVPQEFQQVVAKALNKSPDERYQTASELAEDLRRLRRRLKGEFSVEPLLAADQITVLRQPSGKRSGESARRRRKIETHASSGTWASALTYISRTAENVLTGIKDHPRATIFSGATALVALLFLIPNVPRLSNRLRTFFSPPVQQQSIPFQTIKMAPLTNSGQSVCAAISPDGKSFAHVEKRDGQEELLLTNIANAGTSVVVPASDLKYRGLTFSRDANYLYFTTGERTEVGVLYQVALPGGLPKRVKDGVDSAITFSPTGDRFAFVRFNRTSAEYFLMIVGVDGTGERSIATRRDGNRLSLGGPAWSPDGQTIACGTGWWDSGYHMAIVQFGVDEGSEKATSSERWFAILQVAWLEDESGLLISAQEQPTSPSQLWRISYPQGQSVRITTDANDYSSVSVSRDANTIVSIARNNHLQIWIAPEGDASRARPITSRAGVWSYGLSWTTNGKIVFSSKAGSNLNILQVNADGSNPSQLTVNAGDNYSPVTSPDGQFIIFASNRTGNFNIWRVNASDGSEPKQLTFGDGNFYPSCSADSQWVVYDNQSKATLTLWRVPIDGGEPLQLTDKYSRVPVISPDNQFVACRYYLDLNKQGIAIIPASGGSPVRLLSIPIVEWQRVQWTPDGTALTYIDAVKGVSNIWMYDLANGSRRQLTNFNNDQIFAYAWSPDFKQLACERGATVSDATIISSQK